MYINDLIKRINDLIKYSNYLIRYIKDLIKFNNYLIKYKYIKDLIII